MDFSSSSQTNKPAKPGQTPHRKPSTSELMSSAKTVADAAKASLSHQSDKVDKAKVADAAGNLLGAAAHYGKLEEKSYGKYVGKAETYLHKYGHSQSSSHSSSTTTTTGAAPPASGGGYSEHSGCATGGTHSSFPSGGGNHGNNSGSKYGEYFKMAEGLLKKR